MFFKSLNLLPIFLCAAIPFSLSQPSTLIRSDGSCNTETAIRSTQRPNASFDLVEVFEPRPDNEGEPGDTVG